VVKRISSKNQFGILRLRDSLKEEEKVMPRTTKSRSGSSRMTTKTTTTTKKPTTIKKAATTAKKTNTAKKTTTKKTTAKKSTTTKKSTASKTRSNPTRKTTASKSKTTNTSKKKTQVIIKYDVGYPNNVFVRGNGANLDWNKGKVLKNNGNDEWVWETSSSFTTCEFKVLINDEVYEYGNNHNVKCGSKFVYTPNFG